MVFELILDIGQLYSSNISWVYLILDDEPPPPPPSMMATEDLYQTPTNNAPADDVLPPPPPDMSYEGADMPDMPAPPVFNSSARQSMSAPEVYEEKGIVYFRLHSGLLVFLCILFCCCRNHALF